ncbi:hypothetical protein G3567_11985 [Psychroflexus sp. YR1-1]|uniref:Uncharacterized protein n=1 Tax=Psychroflexus aurantiacus TaxID=2709310 RepID=A0A6B3R2W7_9FLAO|nr:hypothetical protein [Psychroflexus aurantiacus]NEV94863.1 hypothetical protein [Psychroflexus aurantiacus]
MKLIYFLLITTASIYAQPNVNVLSEDEFESIQINGHSISQIRSTNGNEIQIIDLFGTYNNLKATNLGGVSYEYFFKSLNNGEFKIGFSSTNSSSGEVPLSNFEITDKDINLSIKGVNFSVGDNISVLSPLNLEKNTAGNYSSRVEAFLIAPCEGCNNFLYIKYNIHDQSILEVGYIEMT